MNSRLSYPTKELMFANIVNLYSTIIKVAFAQIGGKLGVPHSEYQRTTWLIPRLWLVYQGKPVSLSLINNTTGKMFDIFYLSLTSHQMNRIYLSLSSAYVLPRNGQFFLKVIIIHKNDILSHHLTRLGERICMSNKYIIRKALRLIYLIIINSFK